MKRVFGVLVICFLSSSPLLADLSDIGGITLGNSWTQRFIVNNVGTHQSWDRVEFYMYPANSPPGFENIGGVSDRSWTAQFKNYGLVLATGPLRNTDLALSLTFNGSPGSLQFVAVQFQRGTLLTGETTLATYDHGWKFQAMPSYTVATPESGSGMLVGGSLIILGVLMEKKLFHKVEHRS